MNEYMIITWVVILAIFVIFYPFVNKSIAQIIASKIPGMFKRQKETQDMSLNTPIPPDDGYDSDVDPMFPKCGTMYNEEGISFEQIDEYIKSCSFPLNDANRHNLSSVCIFTTTIQMPGFDNKIEDFVNQNTPEEGFKDGHAGILWKSPTAQTPHSVTDCRFMVINPDCPCFPSVDTDGNGEDLPTRSFYADDTIAFLKEWHGQQIADGNKIIGFDIFFNKKVVKNYVRLMNLAPMTFSKDKE